MDEENLPLQVFVRNDKGQVWGPLSLPTIELLIENQLMVGRLQVSKDGLNFAFPGRFPGIRRAFPRALWGDVVAPGSEEDEAPLPAVLPPELVDPNAADTSGSPPLAGPGAVAAASRPAGPPPQLVAGPGTRQAISRPGQPPPGGPPRPAPSMQAPLRPAPSVQAPLRPSPTEQPPPRPPVALGDSPDEATAPHQVASEAPAPSREPPIARPPSAAQPAPVAVAEIAPPATGDLTTTSPIHLYYLAAAGGLTGLLTLELADRKIEIHFRKGNPEHIGSSHPDDSLGAFLLSKALVTPQDLVQAEGAAGRFGGEVIGALFGLGILHPGTAFSSLAQRAGGLLARALHASRGTFTFEAKELPAGKVMPLGNRWGLLCEQVRKIPSSELRQRLAPALDLPVMKSGGRVQLSELRLTPQETRALGHFDGVRSLNQLIKDLPQDTEHFLRLAFMLRELEAVSFAAVPIRPSPVAPPKPSAPAAAPGPRITAAPVAPPKPSAPAVAPAAAVAPPKPSAPAPAAPAAPSRPSAPAQAAPRPSAPSPAPPSAEIDLPQLRALFEKVKTLNLFEVLGLNDKADGSAVKMAYFKMAKLYHPDTVPPGAPPEVAQLKEAIFGKVGEAYRTLSDETSRKDYLEDLAAGGGGAEKVDIARIFAAEEKFQKGCILVKGRKFPEALKLLEEAIAGNDGEGEFYAWRGFAKFFAAEDRKLGHLEAMKDIALCLKKNERCAQAHYFTGQMSKLLGDLPGANRNFQKCLQLQPDHIDAQRELRMFKKK